MLTSAEQEIMGHRMDTNYQFQPVRDGDPLLADRVSAVFVLALCEGRILAVENERGWDIPGGHLEPGESPLDALRREIAEEAGASVKRICPIGTLAIPGAEKVMLFFAGEEIVLGEFVPTKEPFLVS